MSKGQGRMTSNRSIKGLTALVTGAASGMGLATARLFALEGANVAITDLHQEACEDAAKEISKAGAKGGGGLLPLALDVADASAIPKVIDQIAAHFGGLDIIVNNAGLSTAVLIDDESYERSWQRSLDVLLTAHQRIIRASLRYLRQSKSPRIVNIASTEGLGATFGNSAYAVAKTGVIGLTHGFAVELGREGITVNCVCPGPIHTGITRGIPAEHKAKFARRRTALGRYGEPEEVAHITLSIVLPAASYLTGVAIPVDGGLTIKNA